MLSENSPLFFIYRTMYALFFLKCVVPFLLISSISFPPASSTLEVLDYMLKRSQTFFDLRVFRCISFFDGERFGYLGVCMEIRVAHIVIDSIMSRQSCIHSSFAFTSLDHVTFCLEQYVFKNWLLKLSLCLSTSIFHTISSWYPSSESPPDGHKTNIFAIVFSLMATRW